jgi:hypothetical protein
MGWLLAPSLITFFKFKIFLRFFVNPVVAALLTFVIFVGSP